MQHREREHRDHQRPGHPAQPGGAGGEHGDSTGDRDRDRQPAQAGDLVADMLGQQDVGGPAGPGGETEREPGGVDAALPGVSQQHDADRGQDRPAPAPAVGAVHRDRQRPEELERAGRAERDARDREHEQQHQAGGHGAEDATGQQVPAGEVTAAGPHQDQQQDPGPPKPQARHSDRAELTEQVGRQGQPELDAGHGRSCHERSALGAAQSACQRAGRGGKRAHDH